MSILQPGTAVEWTVITKRSNGTFGIAVKEGIVEQDDGDVVCISYGKQGVVNSESDGRKAFIAKGKVRVKR